MRLYHHEAWDITDRDCESLLILVEHIGLSLQYTRLLNAFQTISEAVKNLSLEPSETR